MVRTIKIGLAAAIALGIASFPVQAQKFSDSYNFLKAVKERNGAEAEGFALSGGAAVINARDGSGEGALHTVVRGRDLNWLGFLLGKGAKPDLQNKEGNSALGLAAQLGWEEGADLLLRVGAKVDAANNRGETPLILAVQNRHPALVRLLVSKGANPKLTDSISGYSALDYAKRDARAGAIVRILEAGPAKPMREAAEPPR